MTLLVSGSDAVAASDNVRGRISRQAGRQLRVLGSHRVGETQILHYGDDSSQKDVHPTRMPQVPAQSDLVIEAIAVCRHVVLLHVASAAVFVTTRHA